MRGALVPLPLLALLLAGCGDPVEEAWNSHHSAPDCGSITLSQGEDVKPSDESIDCFQQAAARGDEARLSLTYPTVEGDPIHAHFALHPDGTVTLFEDSTEDAFGSEEWSKVACYEPDWFPEATPCD